MFWIIAGGILGALVLLVIAALIFAKINDKKADGEFLSDEMKAFERENAVSPEEKRWLSFGAPLMYHNFESAHVFKLMHADKDRRGMELGFAQMWEITNGAQALEQLEKLSKADGHAPVAKEIFHVFIEPHLRHTDGRQFDSSYVKKDFDIKPEQLQDAGKLERTLRSAFFSTQEDAEMAIMQQNVFDVDDKEGLKNRAAFWHLMDRVRAAAAAYEGTVYTLAFMNKQYRYSKIELYNIQNFEAWDYGRTAFVARTSAALGYITQEEAMPYIKLAAENASKKYSNWREYLAAYYLGRAIAFGGVTNLFAEPERLLKPSTSPFTGINFTSL